MTKIEQNNPAIWSQLDFFISESLRQPKEPFPCSYQNEIFHRNLHLQHYGNVAKDLHDVSLFRPK